MSAPRGNIIALTAVQVFRFTAALAVSVLLARGLGVDTFGQYATIATMAHLLGAVANLGIHQLLPRELAREAPEEHARWTRTALRATALGGLIATVTLGVWAMSRGPDWVLPALVAGLGLATMSLVNVYMAVFEGLRRMTLQLAGVAAGRTVVIAGTAAALWLGSDLTGVYAVQLAAWLVTLVLFHRAARSVLSPAPGARPMRPLLMSAVPFAGFVLFAAIQERVDILIIDAFRGAHDVGLYRAATVFLISVPVIARIVATAAYPTLARHHADGSVITPRLARMLRLALVTGTAFAVGGVCVGPTLLTDVLGPEYTAAGPLLMLGACMLPPTFVRITLDLGLVVTDRERVRSVGMITVAIANVLLNLAVVPTYGATGALLTTLLCEVALVVWFAVSLPGARSLRWEDAVARTILPAVVLATVAVGLGGGWLGAVTGSVAWVACAGVTGAVSREDGRMLARW